MTSLRELGQLADRRLEALGLTLTQGGEPTYVACNPTTPEWNITAVGPQKLPYARRFAAALLDSLLPGAVPILSTGKLYPGESVPRWRLNLHQTPNQDPLWNDPSRILLDSSPLAQAPPQSPLELIRLLAQRLQISAEPIPAYEDVAAWMRLEQSRGAPVSLPRFSRAERRFLPPANWSREDQARWEPLCQTVGWVLPLVRDENRWISPRWELLEGPELTLLPGESPLGLRLPLDRIRCSSLKCALTTHVAEGELRLFLPPLPSLSAFRELLRAVEAAWQEASLPPLTLEGYPPPSHPDLVTLSLTADPGVIETNLPPSARFSNLEAWLTGIDQAARRAQLRPFKYQDNGQRVGTGGGAHVLLGGPTLAKNPFLIRPHLLPSFLRFAQHHPSLSYLFSGLFVGPSCQATRPDESLPGTLQELELALRAVETLPSPADPDLVDRILRNLLLDWHGNPHRAEICIDKFCYPFNPDGRLGLVEFRAVEMMPEPDMLGAIHGLFRCLAAAFAEEGFQETLVDWGERLHDQFLLPFFIEQDFRQVLRFLVDRGFPFGPDQFRPHWEHRCPLILDWEWEGTPWEIRQALEPWPVMGSQPSAGSGTSRPVDASMDRLQILMRPSDPPRPQILLVNQRVVPMRSLAPEHDISLAGLRYRRFNNALGLQPQITAHTPLLFDLVDGVSGRIVQSFHYLEAASIPGGSTPRTPEEARARRRQAIVPLPHRHGRRAHFTSAVSPPQSPFTLDLRWASA